MRRGMPRWSLEEELEYLVRHGTISLCAARPGSNKLACPNCFPSTPPKPHRHICLGCAQLYVCRNGELCRHRYREEAHEYCGKCRVEYVDQA